MLFPGQRWPLRHQLHAQPVTPHRHRPAARGAPLPLPDQRGQTHAGRPGWDNDRDREWDSSLCLQCSVQSRCLDVRWFDSDLILWCQPMEVHSHRSDKFCPNVNLPGTWRRPTTGVWAAQHPHCFANLLGSLWNGGTGSICATHTVIWMFFLSLCTTGVVRLHINSWLEMSFCLPHKIHRIGGTYIPPESLERSLKAIRCVWAADCWSTQRLLCLREAFIGFYEILPAPQSTVAAYDSKNIIITMSQIHPTFWSPLSQLTHMEEVLLQGFQALKQILNKVLMWGRKKLLNSLTYKKDKIYNKNISV